MTMTMTKTKQRTNENPAAGIIVLFGLLATLIMGATAAEAAINTFAEEEPQIIHVTATPHPVQSFSLGFK